MATTPVTPRTGVEDPNSDLGFGSVVARESRRRLLNPDGSFNVRREGLRWWESLSIYHHMLTISSRVFLLYVALTYLVANALFAGLFVLAGPGSLTGSELLSPSQRFAQAYFFSVHTLATIGYGNVAPATFAANVLVTAESLLGLLGFAVIAGIVFARFARPVARILFSSRAVVAPYKDITALMFRIVNQRSNQIVDIEAKVLLSWRKDPAHADREFVTLKLERERIAFFPLAWTIVHPIDSASPLSGQSYQDILQREVEVLVLLNGFDETFSQTVHTRSSYRFDEIVWGARFRNMFNPTSDEGVISVDIRRLHDLDPAPMP